MDQLRSIAELLIALVIDPRTGVLFLLLVLASIYDVRTYKIPNWLTLGGTAFALVYTAVVPLPYQGGVLWSLGGFLLGLVLFLPMYVIRAMGAGDVKLIAMTGSFVGLTQIFYVVVATFIVGGIAAIGYAVANRVFKRMVGNIRDALQTAMVSALGGELGKAQVNIAGSVGKMPYGVSISIAAVCYIAAGQLGFW